MTLQERYAQPWRHFHTWDHVERVMRAAQWYYRIVDGHSRIPIATKSAILWHDAVYLPGAKDNEENSIEVYIDENPEGRQRGCVFTDWVEGTILGTKTHEKHYMGTWKDWCPRNVMLSCDLVSLAAPWNVFQEDARNVCKEYLYAYDEEKVRQGRLEFYEKMLKRSYIYPHPYFEKTHGPRAVTNLYRALCRGKAGVM